MAKTKYVYFFGAGKAEGNGSQKNLLGGKGANLAEMAGHPKLKLPVPPGFTVSTDVCTHYYDNRRRYPPELKAQVDKAIRKTERVMKKKFCDPKNPLLLSVRSGARVSMPGMMETVLNIGLTSKTIPGLIKQTGGNERFVYDAYRRLITMYSDVVMEKAGGIEPKEGKGIRHQIEHLFEKKKKALGVSEDTDVGAMHLKDLCEDMKKLVKKVLGKSFPDDGEKQLWGGLGAVFASWNGARAILYREVEGIPHEWGTAVNVQTMVFGNMGNTCATGVAFSRDPGRDHKDIFYGEYLVNAQGEDVVAGIRTPAPINKASQSDNNKHLVTLEKFMPKPYKELNAIQKRLERHYRDMQDIEFTIEDHKLFMLQCRVGKRNGTAAVRIAVDMVKEKLITVKEAVCRVTGDQLDEWLHDILDPKEEAKTKAVARGLPAGPGGAQGKIVFTSEEAVAVAAEGEDVILVRAETNPEDVDGMWAAQAILTERGGMTSHAALVARGWGKCCIVGCAELDIDAKRKTLKIGKRVFKSGDSLSLNGSTGNVYAGNFATIPPDTGGKTLSTFLKMCDKLRTLNVRTNAETPADAALARGFGAEGIGLFRTEHMFYGGDPEALACLRRMILSGDRKAQQKAINQLFRFVKKDIKGTLKAMKGLPVTIRLLDPPLHEFIPHEDKDLRKIARELKTPFAEVKKRADSLHEVNPMMGHRGVRLGITHPEVTEMYVRAILESAGELSKKGIRVFPEIMVPVVAVETEMAHQFELIKGVHKTVCKKLGVRKVNHMVGTMIETPRACLISKKLVQQGAEFFSFGTNDLTQMTFGFSRDDIGGFMGEYLDQGIMAADPFGTLDKGVKKLVKKGVKKGRKVDPKLKIGICGEHGGDPASVKFCHKVGMNYVSCSPYRVPIARLAAAQAVAEE